ncbi:MAG: hypothetical protein HQL72_06905 [Magnetococcales bacterium]|nr:hypothetical protein [Magnetococcales bacterium]
MLDPALATQILTRPNPLVRVARAGNLSDAMSKNRNNRIEDRTFEMVLGQIERQMQLRRSGAVPGL